MHQFVLRKFCRLFMVQWQLVQTLYTHLQIHKSSTTQRKQVYLDSTTLNTLHYLHSNSNLQVNCPNNMTLNYDPEEFCSKVTSADWPATLTMSLILATVAPAAEMGVMATCTCWWSLPVMFTVAPVIVSWVWYMDTGIVTIPGKWKKEQFEFTHLFLFLKCPSTICRKKNK